MTSRAAVNDFLARTSLAIVGVSRSQKKFGNSAYKELKSKGFRVFPVNPHMKTFEGETCYPSLGELPEPVAGVLINVPPAETERVVQDVAKARIPRVWVQQGAESENAIRFCQQNGISVVAGECILMFAEPAAWYHRMHRWVWKLLGKLPK
jgi:predicted CoA-binding protein